MSTLFAGVDLGGTNFTAAIADAEGRIVAQAKEPTHSHEGPQGVLGRIANAINALANKAGARPAALGMGVPGLVDLDQGITKFLPNLPTQWRDVPVRATLEPKIGCPVHLLNDARMATLGELVFGSGSNSRTMILYTLGTGVGGGVVVDRQLRLGPLGAAGELGHMTVLPDGPPCGCGSRGCLETLISGPALTAEGVRLFSSGNAPKLYEICEGQMGKVSPATMGAAARAGDASVAIAIRRAAEWLGIATANLMLALHADTVILAGGVAELGDLLTVPMRETIASRVRMIPTKDLRIERSVLGDKAGLMGGIALAQRGGLKPG